MASRKSHNHCAASGRLPLAVTAITVFGEGGEFKNWMFEQPVKCKKFLDLL